MSIIINEINLINWFNYRGNNTLKFSKGVNVIVGTNNAGKTKLHNGFRFLLDDNVILKVQQDDRQIYQPTKLDVSENILQVFNYNEFNEMKINDTSTFGVELVFSQEWKNRSETKKKKLVKTIKIRKISSSRIEIIEEKKDVQIFNPHTKTPRTTGEDFNRNLGYIIPVKLRPFYLIEGEQMGMMTPLKGSGLKNTVMTLTNISDIDKIVDNVSDLRSKVEKDKSNYRAAKEGQSIRQKEINNKIKKLDEIISEYEEDIIKLEKNSTASNDKIQLLKEDYEKNTENKNRIKELEILESRIERIKDEIDKFNLNFVASFTNSLNFNLSKLDDFDPIDKQLSKLDENFNLYILNRKTELNKKITDEQQRYLSKLNLDQPRPDILEQMVEDGSCYVCSSKLDKNNKEYINEILIPHFRKATNSNDFELNNLESLKDSFKLIFSESKKYINHDSSFMINYKEELAELTKNLIDAEEEKDEYIRSYGAEENLDFDENFLEDYSTLLGRKSTIDESLKQLNTQFGEKKAEKERLEKSIEHENSEDPKFNRFSDASGFMREIDVYLEDLKASIYKDFAENLEKKSTERFNSLLRNNKLIIGQKLVVNVEKNEKNFKTEYNFDISLVDKFGVKQSQTGGASSTLEPLSVVFALIDISENKIGYPFIADAPISRLTPDTKFSFFETLIEDDVFDQAIIISMDLWDNKSENINSLGLDVKNLLESKDGTSFIIMEPKENNNGVNFKHI